MIIGLALYSSFFVIVLLTTDLVAELAQAVEQQDDGEGPSFREDLADVLWRQIDEDTKEPAGKKATGINASREE